MTASESRGSPYAVTVLLPALPSSIDIAHALLHVANTRKLVFMRETSPHAFFCFTATTTPTTISPVATLSTPSPSRPFCAPCSL
nr:hypothetical protein CFP56_34852 [Quercus suber]